MQGHKIRIYSGGTGVFGVRMWYVECECGWEPATRSRITGFWGRPNWESAFGLGVGHQRVNKEVCACG